MHRAHDYRHLTARWRLVARRGGLRLTAFAQADGFPLYTVRSPALQQTGGFYISAGIHGDEVGSTEGLITWAEKHVASLANWPLRIFPCLNPWGLTLNVRMNESGLDLNRSFHRDDVPVIQGLKQVLAQERFRFALMLHEDYDAQGFYLYEIKRIEPFWGESV